MRSDKQKFSSIDVKKKIAITKCFICNQIFYSQNTFDQHMQQHSSKLSKNVPEQIQRKTMQSFKIKKNQNDNKAPVSAKSSKNGINRGSSVRIKSKNNDQANKTVMSIMSTNRNQKLTATSYNKGFSKKLIVQNNNKNSNTIKYAQKCPQKQQTEIKGSKQYREAIRQSTLIIQKMQAFTKKYQMQDQPLDHSEEQPEEQNNKETNRYSEDQFIKKILSENTKNGQLKIIEEIQFVEFKENQALINYRQQYRYLKSLQKMFEKTKEKIDLKKVHQIKLKIIQAIKQSVVQAHDRQQELTQTKIQANQKMNKIYNQQLAYCSVCYERIGYGQDCYINNSGVKIHQQCLQS